MVLRVFVHQCLDVRWFPEQVSHALGVEFADQPARLTNLRTARLADMALVMRTTQWLARPAADFIHPAEW